jgi:hypothetical protein
VRAPHSGPPVTTAELRSRVISENALFAKVAPLAQLRRIEEAKCIVAAAPPKFGAEHYARFVSSTCALAADAAHWLEGFRKAGVNV